MTVQDYLDAWGSGTADHLTGVIETLVIPVLVTAAVIRIVAFVVRRSVK